MIRVSIDAKQQHDRRDFRHVWETSHWSGQKSRSELFINYYHFSFNSFAKIIFGTMCGTTGNALSHIYLRRINTCLTAWTDLTMWEQSVSQWYKTMLKIWTGGSVTVKHWTIIGNSFYKSFFLTSADKICYLVFNSSFIFNNVETAQVSWSQSKQVTHF